MILPESAFISAAERLAAWSHLLNLINVYPVADGDTGTNLKISLSPVRSIEQGRDKTAQRLLLSARGNSGNIAAAFFSEFIMAHSSDDLAFRANAGRKLAWKAVSEPRPGTMLTMLDAVCRVFESPFFIENGYAMIISMLSDEVKSTAETLQRLKDAGVVDSGALGLFIFFERFLWGICPSPEPLCDIYREFDGFLEIKNGFSPAIESGYCMDLVLETDDPDGLSKGLGLIGENIVLLEHGGSVKLHLHADDCDKTIEKIKSLGRIVSFSSDDLRLQTSEFSSIGNRQAVHIMTDAAGSVTREDARKYGITLLESYISCGEICYPETSFDTEWLYSQMKAGIAVSTSQASVYERHEIYESVLKSHDLVLYLCVGSAYTGNYQTALQWKEKNDEKNRFIVLDTGAASGRLGLAAVLTAAFAAQGHSSNEVVSYAEGIIASCDEYLFIDSLKFLAAGGRMSRAGAFFGDLLRFKPIVSPGPDGVVKKGTARSSAEQIEFCINIFDQAVLAPDSAIMLEYSDNREWLEKNIAGHLISKYHESRIMLRPLSLTTGVHAGPGTWAAAFIRGNIK